MSSATIPFRPPTLLSILKSSPKGSPVKLPPKSVKSQTPWTTRTIRSVAVPVPILVRAALHRPTYSINRLHFRSKSRTSNSSSYNTHTNTHLLFLFFKHIIKARSRSKSPNPDPQIQQTAHNLKRYYQNLFRIFIFAYKFLFFCFLAFSVVCAFQSPIHREHNLTECFQSHAISKVRHRYSDTPSTVTKQPLNMEKLRSESFPSCSTSTPSKLAASPESSTPSCPYTGAISKLIDSVATTSQDSGINMFFHDPDDPNRVRNTSTTTSMDNHPPLER